MSEGRMTAADIRAELARRRLPAYKLAAAADLHPCRLSTVLNDRAPLTRDLERRIRAALEADAAREAVEQRSRRG